MKVSPLPLTFLSLAAIVLVALTIQYPLSVTFPIGGDAPFYISHARQVINFINNPETAFTALKNSWYPLSILLFSTSQVIPLDWPTRFIWWMVIGHILVGLLLAKLVYHLAGWRPASLVMIIWAITTTGITSHVEDGTLAQLWSLVFLAFFLERLAAGSTILSLFILLTIPFVHPITGLTVLITLALTAPLILVSFPLLSAQQRRQWLVITLTSFSLFSFIFLVNKQVFTSHSIVTGNSPKPFVDLVVSRFSPFIALSPLGLFFLLKTKLSLFPKYFLVLLSILSLLLAGNDLLGVSVWTERLAPLFVFSVTIMAALSLSTLSRLVFPNPLWRISFIGILLSIAVISAWQHNDHVFRFYENPGNYARLHPAELSAIQWMNNKLSPDSIIITTNKNRHSEWISALTSFRWLPLSEKDAFLIDPTHTPTNPSQYSQLKYVAFFTLRENISNKFLAQPNKYPLIFSNQAVSIYNITPNVP